MGGGVKNPGFLGEGNWGQDHKGIVIGTQANICKSRKNLVYQTNYKKFGVASAHRASSHTGKTMEPSSEKAFFNTNAFHCKFCFTVLKLRYWKCVDLCHLLKHESDLKISGKVTVFILILKIWVKYKLQISKLKHEISKKCYAS